MGANKLLVELDGEPLIRHAVRAALASRAQPVVVVTGNDADAVRAALAGLDVRVRPQPRLRDRAWRARCASASPRSPNARRRDDLPRRHAAVTAVHLDALIARVRRRAMTNARSSCRRASASAAIRSCGGALTSREIGELAGDVGARSLIERHARRRAHWSRSTIPRSSSTSTRRMHWRRCETPSYDTCGAGVTAKPPRTPRTPRRRQGSIGRKVCPRSNESEPSAAIDPWRISLGALGGLAASLPPEAAT